MSEKRIGTLIYDPSMGRFDIRFGIESYYGGLHCGECFDVKVKDAWIPVRIEMDEDWYLVGLPKTSLSGPVSYTHLDVYKRQIYITSLNAYILS